MNRRGFFQLLASGLAVPDELIIPKKSIFLPPIGGWINSSFVSTLTGLSFAENGIIGRYSGYDLLTIKASEALSVSEYEWSEAYEGSL